MIYVALLRGINVGGSNKVDMKKLKSTFESLGFTNVVTYINSGNIIFEVASESQEDIVKEIEKSIKKDFRLEIKVLLRNFENIQLICRQLPPTWIKNDKMRTDVMFLWEKFDNPGILDQIQINEVDKVLYVPGSILWNVEDKDYSKSGMLKLMGTEIYRNMTIRNVNTVRKLNQIMLNLINQK